MKKTPRDWLLAREEASDPKLDAIREAVLARTGFSLREVLSEIFKPNSLTWAGLATVWILIGVIHFAFLPHVPGPKDSLQHTDLAELSLKFDENLSLLDTRP